MKKVLSALVVVAAVAMASSAMASIVNTKHDLSANSTGWGGASTFKGTTTQVCVFCHTPHNSAKTKALWNRNGATADSAFKTYTSGILMENGANWGYVTKGGIDAKSTSLLCMTCHDGVTTMNALQNPPLLTAETNSAVMNAGNPGGTNLGTNLTNDHPINFNYATAVSVSNAAGRGVVLNANPVGVPFQGGNMECSTCHNVHDNTKVPFLRVSIGGSELCLACHLK